MLNIINIDQNNFSISGTAGSGLKGYSKRGVVAKKCEPVYNELFSRVTISDKTSQIVSKTPVSQVSLDSVVYGTAEEFVAAFNEMINNVEATTTSEVTTTTETTTAEATTTIEATTTLEATTTTEPTTTSPLLPNLIANYYFTALSGTNVEDLVGTADGTISGTPEMDGTKFTLDGIGDFITFPLPSVLSSNQYNLDFSINIKFTIFATPAAAKRLFAQSTSFTMGIQIVLNTNRDIYAIITENDVPATSGKLTSGGVVVDVPHNLTVTWNATTNTLKMYMDGTEVTGTMSSNSLNGNTLGMRLGSNLNAAYINADVYELSVFDKVLSDLEVIDWITA